MTTKRRKYPSPASLRELPPVEFGRYRIRRNPYADEVARTGIELVHDEPSAASVAEIPEADWDAARVRTNPYAARAAEALAKMQYGKGRPRRGRELGATQPRSIRLPPAVWQALDEEARQRGTTVHALLRTAVAEFLLGRRRES